MSDFDFDELDRAVNGVISDEPVDTASSAPAVDIPQRSTIDATPVSATSSTSTPAPSAAPAVRRSSGRFMDVVHPSSDMRSGTPASQVAPRQSPAPVAPKPVVEESAPDPFDALEDWQKPLESPFLPDMKVEKRPLGGLSGETPSIADFDALELLEAPDDPRIEAHVMPDPIDFAVAPELEEAEAPSEVPAEPTPESFPEIVAEPTTKEIIETPKVETSKPESAEITSHDSVGYGQGAFQTEPQDVPVGPSSISQQYTEQPSTSPESGAIYDTEAYHQPLAVATKKKSGAWVILWIILIVLLGGGAGAAFYFYVMPML